MIFLFSSNMQMCCVYRWCEGLCITLTSSLLQNCMFSVIYDQRPFDENMLLLGSRTGSMISLALTPCHHHQDNSKHRDTITFKTLDHFILYNALWLTNRIVLSKRWQVLLLTLNIGTRWWSLKSRWWGVVGWSLQKQFQLWPFSQNIERFWELTFKT